MTINFPDGRTHQYESGITGYDIAQGISPRLAAEVLAVGVNGETWDLHRPITADAAIKLYKWDDVEGRHTFWHTSSHLLAEALQAL